MVVFARRLAAAAFALSLVSLSSCSDVAKFDVTQDITEQHVQGNPLGAILPSFLPQPFPITIDVKRETEKRDTGPASSANLSSLSFSITPHAAPRGNFDFVDEIHIFVEPSQGTALPKVEIANVVPVPKGKTVLDLKVVPGIDLLPYINAGARISAQATGHQPAEDVTYDGRVVVTVHI